MNSPHTSIGFFYDFRPVGQGLFSIGRLTRQDETKTEGHDHFTWVHDCGAETTFGKFDAKEAAKQRLAREVNILAAILENDGPLDLLILSHFDNDHIAGLVDLLTLRRVNRLVIPYLTPAERLLILLIDDDPSEDLQRFLAGPVAFVRTLRGGEGAEIMFIGEPPENSTNNEVGGDLNPDDTGKAEKIYHLPKSKRPPTPILTPPKDVPPS